MVAAKSALVRGKGDGGPGGAVCSDTTNTVRSSKGEFAGAPTRQGPGVDTSLCHAWGSVAVAGDSVIDTVILPSGARGDRVDGERALAFDPLVDMEGGRWFSRRGQRSVLGSVAVLEVGSRWCEMSDEFGNFSGRVRWLDVYESAK